MERNSMPFMHYWKRLMSVQTPGLDSPDRKAVRDLSGRKWEFFPLNLTVILNFWNIFRNHKDSELSTPYWAEALPVGMGSLCAAIDPAHDFRWHAMHCGGPSAASFLCEMKGKWIFNGYLKKKTRLMWRLMVQKLPTRGLFSTKIVH